MKKFIDFEIKTGTENMQIDNDLLDSAIISNAKAPTLRLYGWSPACVSLGRNQSEDFLDKALLQSQKIDVVRRLTGGRALLHDKELTYSYIVPTFALKNGESVVESYKEISQLLIASFAALGIELDFGQKKRQTKRLNQNNDFSKSKVAKKGPDYCMSISTGADLCFNGKKLIGSAQLRKQGYILQHGSILFDYDKAKTENIFKEPADENSLTCLKKINPSLTLDEVKNTLISTFMES